MDPQMTTRDDLWSDLLRRALGGDGPCYARFLREATPVIRKIVRARCTVEAEVEDIVQEVLLAVHAKRHTWRSDLPVSPWLYAIARYKAADAARRRRVAVPIEDVVETLEDEATGDVTAARDLARLLEGIDPRAAGIVRAVGVEGESAGEVGARLGMSEGAVRVAYHRAMTKLRQMAEAEDD